jgi:hypothetical protein
LVQALWIREITFPRVEADETASCGTSTGCSDPILIG